MFNANVTTDDHDFQNFCRNLHDARQHVLHVKLLLMRTRMESKGYRYSECTQLLANVKQLFDSLGESLAANGGAQ
jgi:hypothetical protein